MPESFWRDPLMYQGGSDSFLGPRDPIPLADPAWGCDMEAEIVVVTGDVPAGIDPVAARETILLVGLTNDVSLRGLIPGDLAKGLVFFRSDERRVGQECVSMSRYRWSPCILIKKTRRQLNIITLR